MHVIHPDPKRSLGKLPIYDIFYHCNQKQLQIFMLSLLVNIRNTEFLVLIKYHVLYVFVAFYQYK